MGQSSIPNPENTFEYFNGLAAELKTGPRTDAVPMTMEDCVIRMADTISYTGRDPEDAIRLKRVSLDQVPEENHALLGKTSGSIVFNLVMEQDSHYFC